MENNIKDDLKDFFIKYKIAYGSKELDNLLYNIINKNKVKMPQSLSNYSKKEIYVNTVNILVESFENKDITAPKSIMHLINKSLFKTLKKYKKPIASTILASTLLLTPSIINLTKVKKSVNSLSNKTTTEATTEEEKELPKEIKITPINEVHEEQVKKDKYSFLFEKTQINSLNDIYSLQSQIESLNLTDDDKIYKDCPLSANIQWFIIKESIERKIPSDFIFSIINKESNGNFNTSGVQSNQNSDGSYDYGLTQQNSKYAVPSFAKKYNLSLEDTLYLIKYNDYANIIAFCDTVDEKIEIINNIRRINNQEELKDFDVYLIASNYNGGASPSEFSKQYAYDVENLMETIYTHDYENFTLVEEKKKR